jgi:hypothetical protein
MPTCLDPGSSGSDQERPIEVKRLLGRPADSRPAEDSRPCIDPEEMLCPALLTRIEQPDHLTAFRIEGRDPVPLKALQAEYPQR